MSSVGSSRDCTVLTSSLGRHLKQLALIKEFVASHAEQYASFRYRPWTTNPRHCGGLTLQSSKLVPGTLGVFSSTSKPNSFVSNYPGVLMWEELLDEFNKHVYCPTAVDARLLNYTVDDATAKKLKLGRDSKIGGEWTVRVVQLGDPSFVGPLINSTRGTKQVANCLLECCMKELFYKYISVEDVYIVIHSDFMTAQRNNVRFKSGSTELLLNYGDSDDSSEDSEFWLRIMSDSLHCDQCFRKTEAGLVRCAHSHRGRCTTARHRDCASVLGGSEMNSHSPWYCPTHLKSISSIPQPVLGSAAGLRTPSPPASPKPMMDLGLMQPSDISNRFDRAAKNRSAAAAASIVHDRPKHNLPQGVGEFVIQHRQYQQVFNSNRSVGIDKNCRLLQLEHRKSTIAGAGDGLYSKAEIDNDQLVGFFFGNFIPRDQNERLIRDGSKFEGLGNISATQADATSRGVWWALDTPCVVDGQQEYLLIVSDQCPMGYINDPRDSDRVNVEVRLPSSCEQQADGSLPFSLFPVYATKTIKRNSEIFMSYGWSNAAWERMKQLKEVAVQNYSSAESFTGSQAPHRGFSAASTSSSWQSSSSEYQGTTRFIGTKPMKERSMLSSSVRSVASFDDLSAHSCSDDISNSDDNSEDDSCARTSVFSHVSRVSAPRHRIAAPVEPMEALTSISKDEIRQQWKKLEESCRQKKQKTSRRLLIQQGEESTKAAEKRFFAKLLRDCASVKACCASFEKLRNNKLISGDHAFSSAGALLAARIRDSAAWKHDHSLLKQSYRSQICTAVVGARICWQQQELCMSCYAFAIGWSKSTMSRSQDRTEVDLDKTQTHGECSRVCTELASMADEEGQINPLGDCKPGRRLLVLQYTSKKQARIALEDRIKLRDGASEVKIAQSTFGRAVQLLGKKFLIDLNMKVSKKLAKCTRCEEYQNAVSQARTSKIANLIVTATRVRDEHNVEWMEQRDLFTKKKNEALRTPWYINTLTLDGMDTAKTSLPHYTRFSKHADAEKQLQIRVVGGFWFGGPIPCLAQTSFDDVQSKGAAASVTVIERFMDTQWTAMDPNDIAPIPTDDELKAQEEALRPSRKASFAAAASVASIASNDVARPAVDEVQWNEHEALPPLVPFMWPEGLHVTFDNTASDCKNGGTFNFLSMLVAIGVYRWITISTLLVGHTHDIVDQMFSVWSRQLAEKEATTLEEMHTMFRRNYATQIYQLEQLAKQARTKKTQTSKNRAQLADHLIDIADRLAIAPRLLLQRFCIEEKWLFPEGLPPSVQNLMSAHVFLLIEENQPLDAAFPVGPSEGVIVLYSKHLAQSHLDKEAHHPYTGVIHGPWTSRKVMMKVKDVRTTNPCRMPPMPVRTADVRACLVQHRNEHNLTKAEEQQFEVRLAAFDKAKLDSDMACPLCKDLVHAIDKIGKISKKVGSSKEDLAAANKKIATRRAARKKLAIHLAEPHPHLELPDWWTKWIERVDKYIRPYYIKRKLIANLQPRHLLLSGRTFHPSDLPRDPQNPACGRQRVDVIWERTHGRAKVGDLVVARANKPNEPFWIGRVIAFAPSASTVQDEEFRPRLDLAMKHSKEVEAAEKEAADFALLDVADDHPGPTAAATVTVSKSAGAAAATTVSKSRPTRAAASGKKRYSDTNVLEEVDDSVELGSSEPDFDDIPLDELVAPPPPPADATATAAAATPSKKRKKRGQNTCSKKSKAAPAVVEPIDDEAPLNRFVSSNLSVASARSADEDMWEVRWYDYSQDSSAREFAKQLKNESDWDKLVAKEGDAEVSKWIKAKELFDKGSFSPLPACVIKQFEKLKFMPHGGVAHISRSQMIIWGPRILTAGGALSALAFAKVLEDLTEARDIELGMGIDYADEILAAVVAAPADPADPVAAAVVEERKEEEQEEDRPVSMEMDDS